VRPTGRAAGLAPAPGHETRGPGSIYVIGISPGPPPSQIIQCWEDEAAMERAGCDVPGE